MGEIVFYFMKRCLLYIIGLGLCWPWAVSAAEQELPAPVDVYLSGWEVMGTELAKETYNHRSFNAVLLLNCRRPFRFCPAKSTESALQMVDSKGGKTGMLKNDMLSFRMANQGQGMTMTIMSGKWLPTPESSYVDLKGKLSLLISEGKLSITAPVRIELKQGASAPVIMKGAGADNKDVKATACVKELVVSHMAEGRKVWRMTLTLTAQSPTAVHTLNLSTLEQKPLPSGFLTVSESPLTWTATLQLPDIPEKAVELKVHHDLGVKQVQVPIDFRCSWDVPADTATFGRKEGK